MLRVLQEFPEILNPIQRGQQTRMTQYPARVYSLTSAKSGEFHRCACLFSAPKPKPLGGPDFHLTRTGIAL